MNTANKEHQTAIVTGASSGMGLGITRALLEHGYRVVGNSRTISKSKELKASDNLVLVDGDIGKQDTAMKVAEAAIREFGRIDLLVNSAGIYLPKPFTDYTPADFERRSPCRRQVVTRISKQNTKKPGEKGKDYEINQPSNGDCTHPFTQASMCEPIAHQHRTRIPRGSIK